MTFYLSGCTHEVRSGVDRKAGESPAQVSYMARFDDILGGHRKLKTRRMDPRAPIGGRS